MRFPKCEGTAPSGEPCVLDKGHRSPCRRATYRGGGTNDSAFRASMGRIFEKREPDRTHVTDPAGYFPPAEIRRKYRGFLSPTAKVSRGAIGSR